MAVSKVKATYWAFTAYEEQWHLFVDANNVAKQPTGVIAEWGWQTEKCKETGRLHFQGWLRCHEQTRGRAIMDLIPGVHIEKAVKPPQALKNYCMKADTKHGDYVEATNQERHYRPEELLIWIASLRDPDDVESEWRAFETGKHAEWLKDRNIREYKKGVISILRENIKLTTTFMNVAYQKMYVDFREVFVEKAEDLKNKKQTDRQTDTPEPEVEEDTPAEKGLRLLPE